MHPLSLFTSTNTVIVFHSVPSQNWFRNTLRVINNIYKFISAEDIESYFYDNIKFNNSCHICFDDGDKTFYENVYPILIEMNIPATLFVSPKIIVDESNYWFQELEYLRDRVDDEVIKKTICEIFDYNYEILKIYSTHSILMCMKLNDIQQVIDAIKEKHNIRISKKFNITLDQLCELNNSHLISLGAHTLHHPILANETGDESNNEISHSIKELSKITESDVKYFAYPNGTPGLDYGRREQDILKENNIKLAFSSEEVFFKGKTNPLSIPRAGVSFSTRVKPKIYLLPIWNTIRTTGKKGRTESRERKQIKNSSIFK